MTNRILLERITAILEEHVDDEFEDGKNVFRFVYKLLVKLF